MLTLRTLRLIPALLAFSLPVPLAATPKKNGIVSEDASKEAPKIQRIEQFTEFALPSVTPKGWLREYLQRQQKGLSGHPEVQRYPYNTHLWKGVPKKDNKSWWPYEQTAYYLDGAVRLGLLMNDQKLIDTFKENLQWIIDNPTSSGYYGTCFHQNSSHWPNAVLFRAMAAYYQATGDKRIADMYHKHFQNASIEGLSYGHRNFTAIESLLQTYEWTGDEQLKEKARECFQRFCKKPDIWEMTLDVLQSKDKIVVHGVSFCEELKIPILLYSYTGDKTYLRAAENALDNIVRNHMGPSGVPSATEYLNAKDPLQGHETCVSSDLSWTLGLFLEITGEAKYGDMIEKITFNAGPGAVSKDFTNLQYMSSDNQVIATSKSNHGQYRTGNRWYAYSPHHQPECCPGNVHRMMPVYASRMWLKGTDGSVTAALYGPSELSFETEGKQVTITEETAYPFDETVRFQFKTADNAAAPLDFRFRIPGWCAQPRITINGEPFTGTWSSDSFAQISREFKSGDTVELTLPMPVKLNRYQTALSVERGPLLYSLAVPERVEINKKDTDSEQFPTLDIFPDGMWNYALALDEANVAGKVKFIPRKSDAYPFDGGEGAPTLQVPVKSIPGWALVNNQYTPPIPTVYRPEGEEKTITLVPYGTTRLRLTHFPEAVAKEFIPVGEWMVSPAYAYDKRKSLQEQVFAPETGMPVSWTPTTPGDDGIIRLDKLLDTKKGLGYVKATIHSDKEQGAVLAVNGKDACTVWLNGKSIHNIEAPHAVECQMPELIPVALKKGNNTVMVKAGRFGSVPEYRNGWGVKIECVRNLRQYPH